MPDCTLTTEYISRPDSIEIKTAVDAAQQIPDHAIERFAKFLYSRFLADMEQKTKEAKM